MKDVGKAIHPRGRLGCDLPNHRSPRRLRRPVANRRDRELAIVPYLVVRGLTNRVATRTFARPPANCGESPRMDQENAVKPAAAPDQMKLALERTYLAHERTLMAWVRTATSLITFGFTLYKFYHLQEQYPAKYADQLIGPRSYGLIMMGLGIFALAAASWQIGRK